MSFSTGKGPSSACASEMTWYLQRIACLPAETLETNEYNFSQLESVKCEPLFKCEPLVTVKCGAKSFGRVRVE